MTFMSGGVAAGATRHPQLQALIRDLRRYYVGYLFVLPSLILLLIFVVAPVIASLYLSLTNWSILETPKWVGFANYKNAFMDPLVAKSTWNTLEYTVGVVFVGVPVSLILALLVHGIPNRSMKIWLRSIYFLPVVLSTVVAAILWQLIYNTHFGILNYMLGILHIPPVPWLEHTLWAMPAIIIMSIWKGAGYNMVILLAGLQDTPRDIIEAAQIDGATDWQCMTKVMIPMLRPIILLVMVLTLIGSFQVFEQVYVMTQGGPADSTLTLVNYLYNNAFKYYKMGYASAISYLLFVIILAVSLAQFKLFRRLD
ncbi:MAG: sugar ABC transporter permease [Firmicutes bacterium]|nr:sugar ABC transporter permease [Bacillota bacterium]